MYGNMCLIEDKVCARAAQLNEEGKIVKILCEWNGVDIEAVRILIVKVPEMPCEGFYPMTIVDSEAFR